MKLLLSIIQIAMWVIGPGSLSESHTDHEIIYNFKIDHDFPYTNTYVARLCLLIKPIMLSKSIMVNRYIRTYIYSYVNFGFVLIMALNYHCRFTHVGSSISTLCTLQCITIFTLLTFDPPIQNTIKLSSKGEPSQQIKCKEQKPAMMHNLHKGELLGTNWTFNRFYGNEIQLVLLWQGKHFTKATDGYSHIFLLVCSWHCLSSIIIIALIPVAYLL